MRIQLSFVVLAALTQVGATDCGQVIRDPGFDLWCGSELCTWKVERGTIHQVATWHDGDSGVELVGPDTAIEQLAPVNSGDGTCLKFDLVANVDDTAEVFLNVDVEGDGTLEMHERFPTSHWKPLSYVFAIAPPFDGVRFEIAKAGTGKAVVAQIQAATRPAAECAGLTALVPGPRKPGARCDTSFDPAIDRAACASGLCLASPSPLPGGSWLGLACAGCDPSLGASACPTGQVCGLGDPGSPILGVPLACVPTGTRELGEKCRVDGECASAICATSAQGAIGVCSECRAASMCGIGASCAPSWIGGPLVCNAGQHLGAHGAACGTDDDCASSSCAGAERKECRDGRACATPGNCPVDEGLAPGACTAVGVQGGSCT